MSLPTPILFVEFGVCIIASLKRGAIDSPVTVNDVLHVPAAPPQAYRYSPWKKNRMPGPRVRRMEDRTLPGLRN